MKAVCTAHEQSAQDYTGSAEPVYKIGDYMRVYCGSWQDHCFSVKDVRYNLDTSKFEYLYDGCLMGGWYAENCIVPGGSRAGWHYDSRGYCDNPGRGY